MDVVDAAASTRAMCRECGSAIRLGEARFGQAHGPSQERRMRWRHLACAAQAMPTALLRALDFDDWRAVPDQDHDELRGLIEHARRRPVLDPSELSEPLGAARSSSAMAAAAVLEPAHEAEVLAPELARAWVVADNLQSRGDPRGELLALELAAEHTRDTDKARALQREWRGCWQRYEAGLEASKQLRLRWVGGTLLGAHPQAHTQLHALLPNPAARLLERLRFDFCTQDELVQLVALAQAHQPALLALELRHARHRTLEPLAELESLESLRVGDHFDGAWLGRLPNLRALSLGAGATVDPAALARAARLETLEIHDPAARFLTHLGQGLPELRRLKISGSKFTVQLDELDRLARLESLEIPELSVRSLGGLAQLETLREVSLNPGNASLLAELGGMHKLERLAIRGSKVGELTALESLDVCTHLALLGTRVTALDGLRRMPRLRSLVIEGGDMRRIQGLARLRKLEQLGLRKLANLDLSALDPLEQLDTLVLAPGGSRPRQLEQLAKLPRLRRLSLPLELVEAIDRKRALRTLAGIEVLELRGTGLPSQALLEGLPKLRRILLPERNPGELGQIAAANPMLAVFGELAPRDRLGRNDPFDWRALGWLPRSESSRVQDE